MADLDSRSKRASSLRLWAPFVLALVFPDGVLDQGDQQHSVADYSGILAQVPIVSAATSAHLEMTDRDQTVLVGGDRDQTVLTAGDAPYTTLVTDARTQ